MILKFSILKNEIEIKDQKYVNKSEIKETVMEANKRLKCY